MDSMFSPGMYSELNPVYNDVCPPNHMDGHIFNQQQQLPPPYPEQYSSPVDSHNQQLSAVTFGNHSSDQRSFSPRGMSGSSGDLRNMGLPSHISASSEQLISTSPRSHISAANRPDMQWMVTTSHIDVRTLTPPTSVMSQSGLPHGSGLNSSVAAITHSGYGVASSSAIAEQKPIARNKNGKPKGTPGRKRKVEDHDLSPEEAAKRRVRRERNKLAAAKCRNRRRELTDRLQGETDILEDHQGMLTQEIIALQQEKDHLEFILASHTPRCKVLQDKSLNIMGNQSPPNVQCADADCMEMHDHADQCANLVPPIDVGGDLRDMRSSRRQATTVSVIQAGPSLSGSLNRSLNEDLYSTNNSSIVGNENMMHGQYSLQADDPRNSAQGSEPEGRFPATLANFDDLEQVVAGEQLNTPVCTLATPSNTTAVFTFPNTPCVTSSSLSTSGLGFPDAFTSADYNCTTSGSVMSTGNFLHPNQGQGQYNISTTAAESCSAAHRRSSSSESHHSPDSVVQSPTLLSL